jgi:hypothetical protein
VLSFSSDIFIKGAIPGGQMWLRYSGMILF